MSVTLLLALTPSSYTQLIMTYVSKQLLSPSLLLHPSLYTVLSAIVTTKKRLKIKLACYALLCSYGERTPFSRLALALTQHGGDTDGTDDSLCLHPKPALNKVRLGSLQYQGFSLPHSPHPRPIIQLSYSQTQGLPHPKLEILPHPPGWPCWDPPSTPEDGPAGILPHPPGWPLWDPPGLPYLRRSLLQVPLTTPVTPFHFSHILSCLLLLMPLSVQVIVPS